MSSLGSVGWLASGFWLLEKSKFLPLLGKMPRHLSGHSDKKKSQPAGFFCKDFSSRGN